MSDQHHVTVPVDVYTQLHELAAAVRTLRGQVAACADRLAEKERTNEVQRKRIVQLQQWVEVTREAASHFYACGVCSLTCPTCVDVTAWLLKARDENPPWG